MAAKAYALELRETVRLAFDALRAHRLRSYLTLLGVILAVTALVAVMSAVNGLNLYVTDRIANLGPNVFVVDRIGIITKAEDFFRAQRRPLLTIEDYRALASSFCVQSVRQRRGRWIVSSEDCRASRVPSSSTC